MLRTAYRFCSAAAHEFFVSGSSLFKDVNRALAESQCGCNNHPKRRWHDSLVWTNLLLLCPASIYASSGYMLSALMVVFSLSASCIYHWNTEASHWQLVFDKLAAILAFFCTLPHALFSMGLTKQMFIVFIVSLAFWFKRHQSQGYQLYHSLWHFTIFIGQLFLSLHVV
mmetsp:Transcript_9991/g.16356  ORF Transcript_9991/g.16356 Transcript_9991/m.16356 type:complete len:169 (-) Transcript_9991:59-565(-)